MKTGSTSPTCSIFPLHPSLRVSIYSSCLYVAIQDELKGACLVSCLLRISEPYWKQRGAGFLKNSSIISQLPEVGMYMILLCFWIFQCETNSGNSLRGYSHTTHFCKQWKGKEIRDWPILIFHNRYRLFACLFAW